MSVLKRCAVVGLLIVILLLLCGCRTSKVFVPVENSRIVKEIEIVRDTIVEVELVRYESEVVTVRDSSYLENRYANSRAEWDGRFLHHSLRINEAKIPVEIKYAERFVSVTDSVAVPYPVIEMKEINRLTSFQYFQIWCGRLLLIFVVLMASIKYFRR